MSLKFLRSYINWNLLLQDAVLLKKLTAEATSENLTWQVIEEIASLIDFKEMSKNPKTPEHLLHNHSHRFDFSKLLLNNCNLSIDFIRAHPRGLENCWDLISMKINLTEAEMEEFADMIDWRIASRYQKMSESFIKKFRLRVDWERIRKYQNVSVRFLVENCPKEEQ